MSTVLMIDQWFLGYINCVKWSFDIGMLDLELPEELTCPICMSTFKIPITAACGHSFCRSCLINSAKTKRSCPMCRKDFTSAPEKLKQDDSLSQIIESFRDSIIRVSTAKEDMSYESKRETMLLIDVKCQGLILPFNKTQVSFELQNPNLLNKLEIFVARQESPFDKYGVISKIVSVNMLRSNVYQCTLEGKAFCVIESDKVERGNSELDEHEEYFYRSCIVRQIIESPSIDSKELIGFVKLFKEIKDSEILKKMYRRIDYRVFVNLNDPLALIYSMLGVLDIEDKRKYQIITSFNDERRVQAITKKIQSVKHDVSFNVDGFLDISRDHYSCCSIVFLAILMGLVLFANLGNHESL